MGLYSWGNTGANFDNLVVSGTGLAGASVALEGETVISTGENEQFNSGPGDDRFIFSDGGGADSVGHFAAGSGSEDVIDFSAVTALKDFAAVEANATESETDTTISFDGGSVTLIGVQLANLHEDDFIF